jgi:tight adherence protein B
MDRSMSPVLVLVLAGAGVLSAGVAFFDARRLVDACRARRRLPRTVPDASIRTVVGTMVRRARHRREADLVDRDLPAWLDAGARSARAGASLRFALRDGASAVSGTSIGAYLAPFVVALDHDEPIELALNRLASGPSGSARAIVHQALRLAISVGGPSAAVLDAAASTLHERAALTREVRALSTQARASARVMTGAPVVFALGAVQLDARVASFFASAPGAACVAAGLVLDVAGAVWMAQIVRKAA